MNPTVITVLIALLSLCFGGLLTALIFIFGYSNKMAALTTIVSSLVKSFDEHIKQPQSTCTLHSEMYADVKTLKSDVNTLKSDVNTLREKVGNGIQ